MTKRKLEAIKGISTAKAEKVRDAALNVAKRPAFQTAKDLQADRDAHTVFVSTGCQELDAIFGGGVESGSITECARRQQPPPWNGLRLRIHPEPSPRRVRSLWRVPHGQDPALPDTLRDHLPSARLGWWRGAGALPRHGGHMCALNSLLPGRRAL